MSFTPDAPLSKSQGDREKGTSTRPFTPDAPFPKSQGDNIRSKDWNDAVNELRRLGTDKLSLAGGTVTGPLSVTGELTWGNHTSRTDWKNDAGTQASKSGFFETAEPVNYYPGAASWQHLLEARHSNNANNYALQIAGSFYDQNLYMRKTNNNAATAWSQFVLANNAGNVGIGTPAPISSLHIQKVVPGALGPVLTLMNGGGGTNAAAAIDFDSYDPAGNAPPARIQSLDDGIYSSHLSFQTKNPGAIGNSLVERLRIGSNGNVGIGTSEPKRTLHVVGHEIHSGGPSGGFSFGNRGTNPDFVNDGAGGTRWVWYAAGGNASLWTANLNRLTVFPTGFVETLSSTNPLLISSTWQGYPDGPTNRAEISNDTGQFKTLMVIGNRSAGFGRRVSVWDRLEVNGVFFQVNTANDAAAKVMLDQMPNSTVLIGGPWSSWLYIYWKNENGVKLRFRAVGETW